MRQARKSTRRYGAGSVFPVGDRWRAQWELPREGKRRRRQLVADTEAEAWKRMREAQRAEGRSSSGSRRSTESVGAYLERWLADVVRKTRRERTLVGYRQILTAFARQYGERDLGTLSAHEVQTYLNGMDRHPRTVRHHAAALRTAFAYAVRRGILDRNPAADLDLPTVPRVERIPLSASEVRQLLALEDDLQALWTTAAWTGMRQGELLGLRWEDVSLDQASLVVRSSLSRLPGKRGTRYVLTEPKTRRSRRTVPLVPAVVEALRPLRKAYLASPPSEDQNLVFATANGSPLDGTIVARRFQAALARAGVRRVRFHDLRHGFVSLMLEAGVDLATISTLVGHSNIGTTVDLYGHLTETHKRTAIDKLARLA